ncbi:hypothetical protein ZHAS_00015567 [Anopheles sinensis]|uniref:Uncharacterized protein n=1 Tax=Anopheles sinensis TaxID=74873 RepID=A0A084WBK4_ANOSI|nr:hypothetical protein ZHAS_00015567 [Anopheles sinensis]
MPFTRITFGLLISTPILFCYPYDGICNVEIPDGSAREIICQNQTKDVRLYPIAFQPLGVEGTDEHDLFRTGGIAYSCLTFVMHCGTAYFELRCRNVSAIFSIGTPHPKTGYLEIALAGAQNFSKTKNCIKTQNRLFYIDGHVSKYVFIRYCINVLFTKGSIVGYWLFVSLKNSRQDNEKVLQHITSKYPTFKLPSTAQGKMQQMWWVPKRRCKCELYEKYIERAIRCNPPMFDGTTRGLDIMKKLENNYKSGSNSLKPSDVVLQLVLLSPQISGYGVQYTYIETF